MNWDELLVEDCREPDGTLHPHTDLIMSGAHWMLRQLRTDESVERTARGIARLDPGEAWPDETIIDDEHRQECFSAARDAIDALLGEDA